MRKIVAAAVLLLLLFALPAAAPAEEPTPATPTDLECPHAHTRTTLYFFDTPNYTALSAASHRVTGPATAETECEDCGELLVSEVVDNAEEIRPHSMKNGVCALCGYRLKNAAAVGAVSRASNPGERTMTAVPDENGLYVLTLSELDFTALSNAKVKTVLIWGETGQAVLALDVAAMGAQTREAGAPLLVEMEEREDESVFAGAFLVKDGRRDRPEPGGITLRFYREKSENLRFTVVPSSVGQAEDAEAAWNEGGYWEVAYVGEGTYFPHKK